MVHKEHLRDSLPSPHETPEQVKSEDQPERRDPKFPPTPVSSSSSVLQKEAEALKDEKSEAGSGGLTGIAQALKNFVVSTSSTGEKARRHTATAAPMSSITANSVHAQISNPTSVAPSPDPSSPQTQTPTAPEKTAGSSLRRLTLDATEESREKNTPPQTPRVSNHEPPVHPEAEPPRSHLQTARGASPASDASGSSRPGGTSDGVKVSAPRGKLALRVPEARGLRPAYDPYFVTQFEYSEFISKGAKHDAMDVDNDERSRKKQLSAIPIRRTDSDMGRPMAIPMKSRQSSNNSQMDKHEAKASALVTDPHWEHEVVLYVP